MSALRECPFCGGRGEPQETGLGDQLAVVCNECGADGGWHDTEAAAIAAWNRRATPAEVEAEARSLALNLKTANRLNAEKDAESATLRARVERLEGVLRNVMNAPLPAGRHTTTGGVVFVPLIEWAAVKAALEDRT